MFDNAQVQKYKQVFYNTPRKKKELFHTYSVGGRPLHSACTPSWRTILTKASCRHKDESQFSFYSLYTNTWWLCNSIRIYIYCNTNSIWRAYQRATEVTWCFVPGPGVAVFTHAYVIHETIAIEKTFPWKTFKKQKWNVVIPVFLEFVKVMGNSINGCLTHLLGMDFSVPVAWSSQHPEVWLKKAKAFQSLCKKSSIQTL